MHRKLAEADSEKLANELTGLQRLSTGMTDEYVDNPQVFGRWQTRMLETDEVAEAFLRLLTRPQEQLDQGNFEIIVEAAVDAIRLSWKKVHLDLREEPLD